MTPTEADMARQAGLGNWATDNAFLPWSKHVELLERAVAAEREACAKLAESMYPDDGPGDITYEAARLIRARAKP